tara:strand:+ start:82 stop:288 length:207 start_codon:yes stop_codon:yes gene_type:complete
VVLEALGMDQQLYLVDHMPVVVQEDHDLLMQELLVVMELILPAVAVEDVVVTLTYHLIEEGKVDLVSL